MERVTYMHKLIAGPWTGIDVVKGAPAIYGETQYNDHLNKFCNFFSTK